MHELGITQSIVDIALESARQQSASRVLSVTVEVGALSGVIPEAVEFCFEACSAGTLLEGSRLIIERIEGVGLCPSCKAEVPMDPYSFECPHCGGFGLQKIRGEELRIKELEID